MIGGCEAGMKTSQKGIDLIKKFEGVRLRAYLCPARVWTIGYGHTKTARPGRVITQKQADDLLVQDLAGFEAAVNRNTPNINQNQFDSLVAFSFNVGIGAFEKSTLLKLVKAGDFESAADQFGKWVKAGGRVLPGLVTRRNEERALFLS